jgi:hypothetical protein
MTGTDMPARLLCNLRRRQQKLTRRRGFVVIVGAGMAGLECARGLVQRGWPLASLVLLEREARVGGRIVTVERHGLECDLGAAWVHGASEENPLVQLAKECSIELYGGCPGNLWMEPENMLSTGLCLKPDSISEAEMAEGVNELRKVMAEVQVHADRCGDDWNVKLGPTLHTVL